jgi:hypothetical protein
MATESPSAAELPAKAEPLVAYLRSRVREEGAFYVKSRFVAEEVGLSSKEIGAYMRRLQDSDVGPGVEAWAYTNGTTWYVSEQ